MASWEEAFLIFSRWEQESVLVKFAEVVLWEENGEVSPVAMGSPTAIDKLSFDPPTIKVSNGKQLDLNGAQFEFAFAEARGQSVCALEVTLADERTFVFTEIPR
ncbi:MAG TPA: hypothetical protein VI386_31715 [Candidatus Sulfotelmatobacter sp.]